MLLATHIIEEGRGARPKPRESRQMSRRPSPREFREIWLRIGLVLAKRKYWVGNWITIGVLIFSFILNMECFLGTFGDALTADIALLEVDFFFLDAALTRHQSFQWIPPE